jgi:molecular chaperone GrpE
MPVQRDQPPISETDGQPQGESAPETPASPPTDELETLRSELAETAQKADEYLRLAQRTQADFINYRRRMEEERAQQARDAGLSVLQRLLPILDDFERAMSSASDPERQSSWGKGVLLVERNLRALLAAESVEAIGAEGADFDPRLHEALGSAPSANVAEGHVLHIVRQGYRKGDRVLRPTQVIVAKRPG